MNWRNGLGFGLVGALVGGGAMLLAAPASVPAPAVVPAPERAKIETVVREYILANPEIITDALRELQSREVGKVVAANRPAFETPYAGAFSGNALGDVTLVEFFDYACGYCRTSVPILDRLVAEDKGLRVVYRELPVLGPDSEAAARVSLAAARTGKYGAFHRGLFAAGRPEPATLARVASATGVGATAIVAADQAELDRNKQLADAIGVTGTPGFIVGDRVFGGAVGYDTLKKAIADTRAARR